MRRALLITLSLTLMLASCSPVQAPSSSATPRVTVGLPDTWTPAPTAIPSLTPTCTPSPIPSRTPSPTPTDLPLTETAPVMETVESIPTRELEVSLKPLAPGEPLTLTRVVMITADRGWAVGTQEGPYPRILTTTDGGQTWQDRTPRTTFQDRDWISEASTLTAFLDENTAWVYFNHAILDGEPGVHQVWRTRDGGRSWSRSMALPFPLEMRYFTGELVFIDARTGWLRVFTEITHMHDYAYLFRTTDGGLTWALVNRPGDGMLERLVNSELGFANLGDGWMLKDSLGGFEPFLEITRNGGQFWESVPLPEPEGAWVDWNDRCLGSDPHFFGGGRGAFLLSCAPIGVEISSREEEVTSYLYFTVDFGSSWDVQTLPAPVDQLVFLEEGQGFALGREHFRTEDRGSTWEKIKTVSWSGEFSWISAAEAWAVAREGEEIALVHTGDGGESYQVIEPVSAAEQ